MARPRFTLEVEDIAFGRVKLVLTLAAVAQDPSPKPVSQAFSSMPEVTWQDVEGLETIAYTEADKRMAKLEKKSLG